MNSRVTSFFSASFFIPSPVVMFVTQCLIIELKLRNCLLLVTSFFALDLSYKVMSESEIKDCKSRDESFAVANLMMLIRFANKQV